MSTPKVHYPYNSTVSTGFGACGLETHGHATFEADAVTCGRCRRTEAFANGAVHIDELLDDTTTTCETCGETQVPFLGENMSEKYPTLCRRCERQMDRPREVELYLTQEQARTILSALECAAGEYGGDREYALAYFVLQAVNQAQRPRTIDEVKAVMWGRR